MVHETYGDKVRWVFKDFPLSTHPDAFKAAEAAHCAGEQGHYWAMHDRLFADQRALGLAGLKASAVALGLDTTAFGRCLDSGKYADKVRAGMAAGERLGVNSTPSIFINGRPLVGAQPFEAFKAVIEEELSRR